MCDRAALIQSVVRCQEGHLQSPVSLSSPETTPSVSVSTPSHGPLTLNDATLLALFLFFATPHICGDPISYELGLYSRPVDQYAHCCPTRSMDNKVADALRMTHRKPETCHADRTSCVKLGRPTTPPGHGRRALSEGSAKFVLTLSLILRLSTVQALKRQIRIDRRHTMHPAPSCLPLQPHKRFDTGCQQRPIRRAGPFMQVCPELQPAMGAAPTNRPRERAHLCPSGEPSALLLP